MDNMIGEKLRQRRKALGLTQMDVVARTTGLSSGQISDIEKGNRMASLPVFLQLVKALECSSDYLLGISPNTENISLPSVSGLRPVEKELLERFNQLTFDEQQDIFDLMEVKLNRHKATKRIAE